MLSRPKTIESSVSCSFIHPTPNFIRRNCSETRVSKTPSSVQTLQTPLNPTLCKIRNRQGTSKLNINPELASAVVKRYLLPMFEAKSKKHSLKPRVFQFSTEENPDTRLRTGDTVYSDLKLNEHLMEEIGDLRKQQKQSETQLKDSKQQLLMNEESANILREKYENLETNFEFLTFQYNQQTKYMQRIEIRSGLIIEQLEKYKKLYQESLANEDDLLGLLDAERSENDIRLNFVCDP